MNQTLGRSALWLLVTIATAAIAFSAGQDARSYQQGEQLFNASCMECHDLRPIQMQALDMDGWTKIVKAMIEKGAKVKADDIPRIVEYLVTNHGPLPDGAGKQVLLNKCTSCHDLKRIKQHFASPEDWADTLYAMLNEGASLSDEEFLVLLTYLARNFRP
jgi:mono/diheme cytochrome c family protein